MRIAAIFTIALVFAPAAEKRSFVVDSSKIVWQPMNLPGVPAGLQQRALHENKQNKLQSALVRFPKGFREPRHYHTTCGHSMYILKGKLKSPDGDLTPGKFIYAAVNERHGPFVAEEETEFIFYTDGPFDFFVEDKK
jgi:quercetin dioxygenase-like cupin family protein